jgi:fimbrial chaperone protein
MRAFTLVTFLLFSLAALAPRHASALGVEPLLIELSSGSAGRSAQFVVQSHEPGSTPIEIEVFRVELDEEGRQSVKPAPADFIVFPPARMLNPYGKQVFKIQWAGAPLTKSQTYVFEVKQLGVKMPGDLSGISVTFNFAVYVNVAPPSGTRTLDVLSSSVVTKDGKRFASLLLSNSGNVHARLSEASVVLRSGSWSKAIGAGELQTAMGASLVQPGKKRRFLLPFELPREATQVTAEISYAKAMR